MDEWKGGGKEENRGWPIQENERGDWGRTVVKCKSRGLNGEVGARRWWKTRKLKSADDDDVD